MFQSQCTVPFKITRDSWGLAAHWVCLDLCQWYSWSKTAWTYDGGSSLGGGGDLAGTASAKSTPLGTQYAFSLSIHPTSSILSFLPPAPAQSYLQWWAFLKQAWNQQLAIFGSGQANLFWVLHVMNLGLDHKFISLLRLQDTVGISSEILYRFQWSRYTHKV